MLLELLVQAACVSLFLPGGQGRVYPGRKKPASFAVERRRVGPHVCFSGFGSGCCPGWMLAPGSGQCTLPLCPFGCGSGFCIAPNLCSCPDGEQGITCPEPPGTCGEYGCDLSCNHGGCQEVARVCPLGFSMVETANGIRCTDIDECLSAACEGLCVNTEGGFVCECGPGMQLSADRHSCQDTDECLATPCQHRCKNSVGSYRCSCWPGYHLHGNRHSCVDVNECRRPGDRRACQHACHNTPGSYLCSCRPGYRLSGDRVSCEGFPKSILAPSPILQSLQHPPTLVLLPPGPGGPLLVPRGSPSSHLPAAPPGTQPPPSSPTTVSPATELSPRGEGAPGTASPAPRCWYRGALREPGTRWMEPGCRSCACQGGRVLCEAVSCPVPCSHPLPAPAGGCCPSCTGCLHEGVARAEGDVFSPSDGNCTVCVCLAGNVSCISPECPPGSCPSASPPDCCSCQPAKCSFRGRTYVHGARFSLDEDDCTTCVCRGGEVECSFAPCPALDCPQHQRHLRPGQCCFTCRDPPRPSGCFVDDNGVEFPIGQIWSPGDPCELCICQADGSVSCKRTDCVETCPYPIHIPGQCCPDCSAGCTYMGQIFYNNETFPSLLDPCLSCICLLGSVACSPVDCTIFCTYPFHPEGECCPVCNDCNYEGRKVVNGQTFSPEGQPCTRCTCQVSPWGTRGAAPGTGRLSRASFLFILLLLLLLPPQLGEVSCEERPCPHSCSEPPALPAACCPACQDTQLPQQSGGGDASPSPSPSHEDLVPTGTPQPPRHRLAQLLLHAAPFGPSPGGEPPSPTPSPPPAPRGALCCCSAACCPPWRGHGTPGSHGQPWVKAGCSGASRGRGPLGRANSRQGEPRWARGSLEPPCLAEEKEEEEEEEGCRTSRPGWPGVAGDGALRHAGGRAEHPGMATRPCAPLSRAQGPPAPHRPMAQEAVGPGGSASYSLPQ
ncbi:von Willebrand factor C and EGF domain-containing protein isoform X2 [Oxyura jamaicensis]|uniref:von Willebrand factor C and EGF domain-containing protein isoform X2 n=1 Tax=Oxyura jamaicensis TaxID=8884 RepID=UPI0015A5D339|nr:von Willebrand factor C and EGF domain-containing protein isoform X2 [Oxyura jamaicensis]